MISKLSLMVMSHLTCDRVAGEMGMGACVWVFL